MIRNRRGAMVLEFALPPGLPALGEAHPLRRHYVQRLYLAFAVAATCHLAIFMGMGLRVAAERVVLPGHTVVINPGNLAPPPSLTTRPEVLQDTPEVITPSSVGVPDPVKDFLAPNLTMPDNASVSRLIDAANLSSLQTNPGDSIVVRLPPLESDRSPDPGEFVPYEEKPVLINIPAPVYPEMARMAEMEGTVLVTLLVGKDGRVKKVLAGNELPMLREPAMAAAYGALFRPALQQHRPVEVWVRIPMRFTLH